MSALRAAGADQVTALAEFWSDTGWPLLEEGLLTRAAELGWQPFVTKGYFTTDLPIAANRASYVTINREGTDLVTQVDFKVADRPANWSAEGIAEVASAFAGYSRAFEERWGAPIYHAPRGQAHPCVAAPHRVRRLPQREPAGDPRQRLLAHLSQGMARPARGRVSPAGRIPGVLECCRDRSDRVQHGRAARRRQGRPQPGSGLVTASVTRLIEDGTHFDVAGLPATATTSPAWTPSTAPTAPALGRRSRGTERTRTAGPGS